MKPEILKQPLHINDITVYDCETTMRGGEWFSADPFYPDNKILCHATSDADGYPVEGQYPIPLQYGTILAGHNIKFDLAYMRKQHRSMFTNVARAFDTQGLHHLLTGEVFTTLDYLCEYYDVPIKKSDALKDWLAQGKNIESMPTHMLNAYLTVDIKATQAVLEKQIELINQDPKLIVLANIQSYLVMALAEMEWNGLRIDVKELVKLTNEHENIVNNLTKTLIEITDSRLGKKVTEQKGFKYGSVYTINSVLYGRPTKYKAKLPVGFYKNGKVKTKVTEIPVTPTAMCVSLPEQELNKQGNYSVDEKFLSKQLVKVPKDSQAHKYILTIMELRKSEKILSTYCHPICDMLDKNDTDTLHPTYNIAATPTGRLSSSKPNAQNLPKVIKDLIIAKNGYREFEGDWKQLEVCGAAIISGDTQLIKDIVNKVDIHAEVSKQANLPPEARRTAKGVVFGTIYGGGPTKLAAESGVDIKTVKAIQKALKERYPNLFAFYSALNDGIAAWPPSRYRYVDGQQIGTVKYESISGRRYWFDILPKKWGFGMAPSWTETCNWPVQGFSTGDLVPIHLACLYYWKSNRYEADVDIQLVTTVHDSIRWGARNLFDGELSNNMMKRIMDKAIYGLFMDVYKLVVGEKCPVPLTFEIEEIK
jgi:hypothetical protein